MVVVCLVQRLQKELKPCNPLKCDWNILRLILQKMFFFLLKMASFIQNVIFLLFVNYYCEGHETLKNNLVNNTYRPPTIAVYLAHPDLPLNL